MGDILTEVTDYFVGQSWQIAVLVVAIALLSLLLKNRSAHVRYLLWLVVLGKCLVPAFITVPLAILPEREAAAAAVEWDGSGGAMSDIGGVGYELREVGFIEAAEGVNWFERLGEMSAAQWLGMIWAAGFGVYIFVTLVKAWRLNSWLKEKRKGLSPELDSEIRGVAAGLGIKRFVRIWLVEETGQPFVWGLIRGSVYLPADFAENDDSESRAGILGHEMGHVLRYDAGVNLLQVIAQGIFWFHPFVWWANKKIRAEREKCCDEMTVAGLGANVRKYSSAIINTLTAERESRRAVPSLAIAGPVKNIEERIKTIMRPGKKFYRRPSFVVLLAVLILAAAAVPTTLALTEKTTDSPEAAIESSAVEEDRDEGAVTVEGGKDADLPGDSGKPYADEVVYPKNWDQMVEKMGGPRPIVEAATSGFSSIGRETSFGEALEILKNSVEPPLNMVVNWRQLESYGIDKSTAVGIEGVSEVKLGTALKLLLWGVSSGTGAEISYVVRDGIVIIATVDSLPQELITQVYDITSFFGQLANIMMPMGGGGGYGGGGYGMGGGQQQQQMEQRRDDLIDLIQSTIEPDSWFDAGGEGSIDFYENKKLVILQTRKVHNKITKLLRAMRRSLGRQVSIEARFLLVGENFLDDIGWGEIFRRESDDVTEEGGRKHQSGAANTCLDENQRDFLLRTAQSHRDAKSLIAPKVTVLDGELATFKECVEVPCIRGYQEPNEPGQEPRPIVDYVEVGQSLRVRVEIQPDEKSVFLEADAEFTELEGFEDVVYAGKYPCKVPKIDRTSRKIRTLVPDGGTVMFDGGEIEVKEEDQKVRTDRRLVLIKPVIQVQEEYKETINDK